MFRHRKGKHWDWAMCVCVCVRLVPSSLCPRINCVFNFTPVTCMHFINSRYNSFARSFVRSFLGNVTLAARHAYSHVYVYAACVCIDTHWARIKGDAGLFHSHIIPFTWRQRRQRRQQRCAYMYLRRTTQVQTFNAGHIMYTTDAKLSTNSPL